MESVHLHFSNQKINEIKKLVKNKKIIVLNGGNNKITKNKNTNFVPFNEFLSSKSVKEKGGNSHKEIIKLIKLIIKRYDLLGFLIDEYKKRGDLISKKEANIKLINALYSSVCWIYQLVSIKEIILQNFSNLYQIDSFSKFEVSGQNYFSYLDDTDLHKRIQFSDLWHTVIFSDLASLYFPNAKEIIFKYEEKFINSNKFLFLRKLKKFKTINLLKSRSIFFKFYKLINRTDYLFINTCFTKNYLEKCRKELGMLITRIPATFFNEFQFNEYLFDLKDFINNEDYTDLKGSEKIIIKNLPLSATTLFKNYLKFSRNYKDLNYKNIISSGGLCLLTMLRYHLVLFKSKENILFAAQHGAGVGFVSPMHEEIEKIYCDCYLNWGFTQKNSIAKKEISISCTRPLIKVDKSNLDGKIYIFLSAYPYQPTRMNAELNYNIVALREIPIFLEFLLEKNINIKDIVIRPFPAKTQYYGLRYSNDLEYLGNYLAEKFPFIQHETNRSGDSIQAKASLVINTYFSSAGLFQRFHADLPFLVFDIFKGEWITDEFKETYLLLKKAKIVFDDPIELSNHIYIIKGNINKFWESNEVRFALEELSKKFNSKCQIYDLLKQKTRIKALRD